MRWTYTLFENRNFAPHLISSHFDWSVNSSPTASSRFNDCDQHFPGWSEWTPDSPAIHTTRSAHFESEIRQNIANENSTTESFMSSCYLDGDEINILENLNLTTFILKNNSIVCFSFTHSIWIEVVFKWREMYALQKAVGQTFMAISIYIFYLRSRELFCFLK